MCTPSWTWERGKSSVWVLPAKLFSRGIHSSVLHEVFLLRELPAPVFAWSAPESNGRSYVGQTHTQWLLGALQWKNWSARALEPVGQTHTNLSDRHTHSLHPIRTCLKNDKCHRCRKIGDIEHVYFFRLLELSINWSSGPKHSSHFPVLSSRKSSEQASQTPFRTNSTSTTLPLCGHRRKGCLGRNTFHQRLTLQRMTSKVRHAITEFTEFSGIHDVPHHAWWSELSVLGFFSDAHLRFQKYNQHSSTIGAPLIHFNLTSLKCMTWALEGNYWSAQALERSSTPSTPSKHCSRWFYHGGLLHYLSRQLTKLWILHGSFIDPS